MAIEITTRQTGLCMTGRSHWWGAPDLPEDVPYPCVEVMEGNESYYEPLTFVCQIRCKDIASLDPENLLPHSGMLYFFAPIDYFLGEYDSPLDYHEPPVVIFSEKENGLAPYRMCWEGTDESIFRPAEEMVFSMAKGRCGDGHMLLGEPYQDEIRDSNPGYVQLLQIDEDDRWGLRFHDCGTYYFLIPAQDLKDRRWNRVRGALFFF